jgi:hypothetical protein
MVTDEGRGHTPDVLQIFGADGPDDDGVFHTLPRWHRWAKDARDERDRPQRSMLAAMNERADPRKPMSARKKRFLVAGAVVGAAMVIVPFVTAAASIARASRVPDGLRGATHIPAMKDRVGFALGSASLTALLAPPGILLFVLSSLPLAEQKRRRDRR